MASIPFCEPCHRGNNPSEAVSWCSDCVESLCLSCDTAHRINKITLSHTLLRIEDMPPEMTTILSAQKYCPVHSDLVLDLYCVSHDALCCRSCMTERHRGCERLQPLDIVAKGIRQSLLLETVSENLDEDLKTLQKLTENRTENLKRISKQAETIKQSIADVKQRLIDRLDSLEHTLLSELSTAHLTKSSDIEKQQELIVKFIEKTNESQKELDFVKEYGSNSQVFITLQNLKISTKEDRKRLKGLSQSLKEINLIYNQPKNQESHFTTLGTLTTKTEPSFNTSGEQKTSSQDKIALPVIRIRQTPRTSRNSEIRPTSRNPSEKGTTIQKPPEIGLRSGLTSRSSNVSSKTRAISNSPVNDCKTS